MLTETESLERSRKAAKVVDVVDLKDIRLEGCVVRKKLQDDRLPTAIEMSESVQVHLAASDDRILVVDVALRMCGHYGDLPKNTPMEQYPLMIVGQYKVVYSLRQPGTTIDTDHWTAFGEQTGLLNVWPYWREFLSSMTAQLGLPQLVIPLLKFRPFVSE